MSERNVLTTVIVLLLAIPFGLDPGPGKSARQSADVGFFSGTDLSPSHHQTGSLGSLVIRRSVIPVEFVVNSTTPIRHTGIFESSLNGNAASETEPCREIADGNDETNSGGSSEECSLSSAMTNAVQFDIGFPLQASFNGAISTDEIHITGDPAPNGPGGGGKQPTPDEPIPTPEPGSLLTLVCGLLTLSGLLWKRPQRVCAEARSGKHR